MDSYSDVQVFSIPKEDTYRHFLVDTDLGSEAPQYLDLGDWEVRIGDKPLFFRLHESLLDLGTQIDLRFVDFYNRYDVIMIPHRIGVRRRSGKTRLKTVSIEIQFDLGRAGFSIVSLFPSVMYKTVSTIGAAAKYLANIEGTGSLENVSVGHENTAECSFSSNAKLSLSTNGEVHFQLSSRSLLTGSMGEGGSRSLFQFQGMEAESEWQNIEAWSTLAVPKGRKRVAHSLSVTAITSGIFPKTWSRVEHIIKPMDLIALPANGS